jgi:hypothetical protein
VQTTGINTKDMVPVKKAANNKKSVDEPNPRQMVKSWILAGLSRERILWMLEALHGFRPGQCRRLYSLVEEECSQTDRC